MIFLQISQKLKSQPKIQVEKSNSRDSFFIYFTIKFQKFKVFISATVTTDIWMDSWGNRACVIHPMITYWRTIKEHSEKRTQLKNTDCNIVRSWNEAVLSHIRNYSAIKLRMPLLKFSKIHIRFFPHKITYIFVHSGSKVQISATYLKERFQLLIASSKTFLLQLQCQYAEP